MYVLSYQRNSKMSTKILFSIINSINHLKNDYKKGTFNLVI